MVKSTWLVLFAFFYSGLFFTSYGQELVSEDLNNVNVDSVFVDLKYREDQFYFGLTHTLTQSKPQGFSPYSFSLGLNVGFLRDMPINKQRTFAIAPGIGFSYNNLRSNLGITPDKVHVILPEYKKSSLSLHYLDFPLEFRWRNSNATSHKFWRVYLGIKASYLLSDRTKTITQDYSVIYRKDPKINKWQYGIYASAGFNTWNFYVYYGLNEIYKSDLFANDAQRVRMLNLGLMFYIL
ncbi:porin family protein [Myroides sp. LJL119]